MTDPIPQPDERRAPATRGAQRPTAPLGLQASMSDDAPTAGGLTIVLGLAIVGALGAALSMTKIGYGHADVAAMRRTPQWVGWIVILAVQTGAWMALTPPVITAFFRSRSKWSWLRVSHGFMILLLLALPFVFGVFEVFQRSHDVQRALQGRLALMTALGSIVGWIAAGGVIRTDSEIDALAERPGTPTDTDVNEYLELRRRLIFLGGVLALSVALAVMATGGLRNTIVAMETVRATESKAAADASVTPAEKSPHLMNAASATARAARFGVELVWSYGLYYSFVLMLAYLPAYLSLISAGRRIRDRMYEPLLPGDFAAYEARKKQRDAMDDILQLRLGAAQSLKAASLVLVPLLTSFASTLLGGVKVG